MTDYIRHHMAKPEGGVQLSDDTNMISNVAKDIMKKIGASLAQGEIKNLLKIPTPAYVHQDNTYLSIARYEFGLIEKCLQKCKEEGLLDSPFQRIKYIVASQVGAISNGIESVGLKSPINPILGETMHMTTEFGSNFYAEQTCHHPPISHFLMEGPPELPFKIDGHVEVRLDMKGAFSSLVFSLPGIIHLTLPDGSLIEMSTKTLEVTGILSDKKTYTMMDVMNINDVTNGVNASVTFDCNKDKRGGFFSFGGEKKDANNNWINRTDLISIQLTDDADNELDRGEGSYLERVQFGGKDFWRVDDKTMQSVWKIPGEDDKFSLLSDSECRADLQLIRAEQWEEAEIAKVRLEEDQRADKKLRDKSGKSKIQKNDEDDY